MEFENERVLKLIFPDGVPAETASDPALLEYLVKLGASKADVLRREEARLSEEMRAVVAQTQDLAICNYKTFILTSECSREIYKDFRETEQRLDNLVQELPKFSDVCEQFIAKSNAINAERRVNSSTLKKNTQILEILELPQLMDNCIKSGRYEEALEVAAYVQRLGQRHGDIAVMKDIVKSIEGSWHTMLMQLLGQLKMDLQLPKCLQVIGYLRRMQAFNNLELKLKFLQARDNWLKQLLASIPQTDPQQHLTKTIEVTRVNVFNIITQYKAIFGDDEDGTKASARSGTCDSNKIFYMWLHRKVDQFLKTLEVDLSRGVSSLDTILGQCMYFGLSFSRVGADFRGLMAPIFVRTISGQVEGAISRATAQFQLEMDNYTLINRISSQPRKTAVADVVEGSDDESAENMSPPESLLDFRPLATYCNAILAMFNELRHCAPVAVASVLVTALEASLQQVATVICAFHRQEEQALSEQDNFLPFCSCFVFDLIPYLQRCVNALFPVQTLAMHLGGAGSKGGGGAAELTTLRQLVIVKPIEHLLPAKLAGRAEAAATIKEEMHQHQEENATVESS